MLRISEKEKKYTEQRQVFSECEKSNCSSCVNIIGFIVLDDKRVDNLDWRAITCLQQVFESFQLPKRYRITTR